MTSRLVCSATDMKCWVEGSTAVTGECGHDVWVSPAMKEMAKRDDIEVVCLRCHGVRAGDEEVRLTMTPAQRDELNELLGVGEVDQLVTQLGLNMEDI